MTTRTKVYILIDPKGKGIKDYSRFVSVTLFWQEHYKDCAIRAAYVEVPQGQAITLEDIEKHYRIK